MRECCNRWYSKVIRPSTFSRFAGLGPRIFCSCNRPIEDKALKVEGTRGVAGPRVSSEPRDHYLDVSHPDESQAGSVLTEAAKRVPKALPWPQKNREPTVGSTRSIPFPI